MCQGALKLSFQWSPTTLTSDSVPGAFIADQRRQAWSSVINLLLPLSPFKVSDPMENPTRCSPPFTPFIYSLTTLALPGHRKFFFPVPRVSDHPELLASASRSRHGMVSGFLVSSLCPNQMHVSHLHPWTFMSIWGASRLFESHYNWATNPTLCTLSLLS